MPIRPAQAADEQTVRWLLATCELPTTDLNDRLLASFLVEHRNERLVGAVGLEVGGEVALLRSLAVTTDERRRGRGSNLLRAAEDAAKTSGIRVLYLLTTTAVGFFERLGYRAIERTGAPAFIRQTQQFISLCPSSSTLMEKVL